jgi:hypothetical protein
MRPINVCLLSVLCFLAACSSQEAYESKASEAPAETEALLASADSTSFASDIADIRSASRKVIRTADFRCRVNDVFTAATALENVVKGVGGIVEESRMANNDSYSNSLYHTADSLKQVHAYTTTSYLTLRVPVASLDSVIKAIPELATFIEHRNLSQEDVTLKYLANSLKNDGGGRTTKAMDIAKKSEEVIAADEYLTQKHDNIVDRQVQNLALLDESNYATIKVEFFQPERINTQVAINPEYFAKPTFGLQFTLALSKGWNLLRELLIALLSIWPLIASGIAGWFAYKKYRRPALLKAKL